MYVCVSCIAYVLMISEYIMLRVEIKIEVKGKNYNSVIKSTYKNSNNRLDKLMLTEKITLSRMSADNRVAY